MRYKNSHSAIFGQTIIDFNYLTLIMEEDDFLEKMGDFLSRKARSIRDRFTFDETDLIRAVGKNGVDEVQRVLSAGVDPDKGDIIGRRALTMAVDGNNEMIVAMLLKAGANPNLPGKNGDTALHKAIFWENSTIISLLMDAGADPSISNSKGISGTEAVRSNGVKSLMVLVEQFGTLKKKQKVDKDKDLHERQKAQAEKAKLRRAETDKQAKEAAQKDAQEAAFKRYPKFTSDPLLALIQSIQKLDEEAFALFITQIEEVNQWDESLKTTPLLAAVNYKNAMATGILLERNADPLAILGAAEHSAFSLAIQKKAYGLVAKIFELYPAETKVYLNNPEQDISPQFLAYRDPKLFNLLIKGGADPYFGGKEGESPIVKAIAKGGLGLLPVLVRHEIPLNKVVSDKTPIEWAIFYNRLDWVQGLIAEEVKVTKAHIDYCEKSGGRDEILAALKN